MEPSEKRREASRRNGSKSKGAITPEGKETCAQNPTKWGFHARPWVPILRGPMAEDPERFFDYRARLIAALAPRDDLERESAERIVDLLVRERRMARAEPLMLDAVNAGPEPLVLGEAYDSSVDVDAGVAEATLMSEHEYHEWCQTTNDGQIAKAAVDALEQIIRISAKNSRALDRERRHYKELQQRDLGPEADDADGVTPEPDPSGTDPDEAQVDAEPEALDSREDQDEDEHEGPHTDNARTNPSDPPGDEPVSDVSHCDESLGADPDDTLGDCGADADVTSTEVDDQEVETEEVHLENNETNPSAIAAAEPTLHHAGYSVPASYLGRNTRFT